MPTEYEDGYVHVDSDTKWDAGITSSHQKSSQSHPSAYSGAERFRRYSSSFFGSKNTSGNKTAGGSSGATGSHRTPYGASVSGVSAAADSNFREWDRVRRDEGREPFDIVKRSVAAALKKEPKVKKGK